MKKLRVVLLSAIIVSTILGSTFTLLLLRPSLASPAPSTPPAFMYTAKWICNIANPFFAGLPLDTNRAESIGLVPGEYKTDINVHNPNAGNVTITKKIVASLAESQNVFNVPKGEAFTLVGPDAAFRMDCLDIFLHLPCPLFCINSPIAAKGFVSFFSSAPNLDVVAEYSSESFNSTGVCLPPSCVSTGVSLDVQRITSVSSPVSCLDFALTANPSSVSIFPGTSAKVVKTITSLCGFSGTVCLSATVSPPGPTVVISPTCVTVPSNGTATIVEVISTTSSTPPNSFITNTACSTTPSICHTALVIVNVP